MESCDEAVKNAIPDKNLYKVVNDGYCFVHLYDQQLQHGQLWIMQEHPTRKGFYYLKNAENENYRLSYGTPEEGAVKEIVSFLPDVDLLTRKDHGIMMIKSKGAFTNNDLFAITQSKDGYYFIRPGLTGEECMTVTKNTNPIYDILYIFSTEKCSNVRDRAYAKWKLVPRVKLDSVSSNVLYHLDNRQSDQTVLHSLKITRGVTVSETTTARNLQSFGQTIETAIEYGIGSGGLTLEFSQEIEESFESSREETWTREVQETIYIPAHKNLAVVQMSASLEGEMDEDSLKVLDGKVKIYVSDDEHFRDDDGNIINIHKLSSLSKI